MGSHSVTCHPTEVRIPPLSQPKQVLDLATPEGCKAAMTYVTWKRTGWKLNPPPVNRKSNALPLSHHTTQCQHYSSAYWSIGQLRDRLVIITLRVARSPLIIIIRWLLLNDRFIIPQTVTLSVTAKIPISTELKSDDKLAPYGDWWSTLCNWRFCQVQSHVTPKLGQISSEIRTHQI